MTRAVRQAALLGVALGLAAWICACAALGGWADAPAGTLPGAPEASAPGETVTFPLPGGGAIVLPSSPTGPLEWKVPGGTLRFEPSTAPAPAPLAPAPGSEPAAPPIESTQPAPGGGAVVTNADAAVGATAAAANLIYPGAGALILLLGQIGLGAWRKKRGAPA